jgi:hypothetical protein
MLRWKAFERSMRPRIRAELRASETLWKEFRQARKRGRILIHDRPWLRRLFFLAVVSLFLTAGGRSIENLAALIVIWTICTMFMRAAQFHGTLHYGPNLVCFYGLPIPDENVFQVQWRQFLQTSLWSAADFAVLYFFLVLKMGGRFHSVEAGIGLGLIQWLFIPVASLGLMLLLPARTLYNAFWVLPLLTFGFFWLGPVHESLYHQIAAFASWIPPVGWIFQVLGISPAGGFLRELWPCVLAALLLAASPFVWQRARRTYSMPVHPAEERTPHAEQFSRPTGDIQDAIRRRAFIAGLDWRSLDVVERGLSRLLTPREKVIADFMVAGVPDWTPRLKRFVIVLAAATLGFGFLAAVWNVTINPFLLFLTCAFLASGFLGGWCGFATPHGTGSQSPFYAGYPIGFWELARVVLKIDLARFLIALPLLCGAISVLQRCVPLVHDMEPVAFKILALYFILFPLFPLALISPGTNDTQRSRFALMVMVVLLTLLGGGITFFMATSWRVVAVAGVVSLAASMLALFLYGRMFNLNRFDLVPVPEANPSPPQE